MIATTPPGALSTLNILPATITTLQTDGTGVTVTLASGTDTLTAQVPARVAAGLTQGLPCHAILPTLLPDTGDPGLP
jgi:ABC-type molybdate transport system ATPase subunit